MLKSHYLYLLFAQILLHQPLFQREEGGGFGGEVADAEVGDCGLVIVATLRDKLCGSRKVTIPQSA